MEASTRGDGDIGEVITHNISAFYNVPIRISHKGRLVITGEGFIHKEDFGKIADSRGRMLEAVGELGFVICPFVSLSEHATLREIEDRISQLKNFAENKQIPIDGMVLRYDSLSYSKSCGRTGHHYRDGIAFKFEDDTYETVFRFIEWEPGRFGEIALVAIFDTVEIDGCSVSRAGPHNLSFIRDLELSHGCRILVSKRNMIIPHIEENLDRGHYSRGDRLQ